MGLMDVLNGMQNGPHGPKPGTSGGMSPVTMAVIGLLAYKAFKQFTGSSNAAPAPAGQPNVQPPNTGGGLGGGLGGLLSGGLGGLLAGGAAGSVLSGGLGDLLKQFQQAGQSGAANSWVGHGANQPISPNVLEQVLDSDQISTLIAQTGLSKDQVLHALSQYLPGMVDGLTPNGRLPSEDEVSRMVQ
ncbi:MAG TPA: YidB family protein [Xanthobacteraceae bacterium]|nr:YidB family protein [Xanthobacteraceae bacterium]